MRAVEEPERVFLAALVERETRAPANPALEIHHVPANLFQTDPVVPAKVARTMVEADRLRDD